MDVFERLAITRRSVRIYRAEPIPRERLRALIDLASRAPSNFNRQPWQFVVADTPEWSAALNELIRNAFERVQASERAADLFHLLDHVKTWLYPRDPRAALIRAFYTPPPERLAEQLSSILEGGDVPAYTPTPLSLGMAIQTLLLAAHACGLSA